MKARCALWLVLLLLSACALSACTGGTVTPVPTATSGEIVVAPSPSEAAATIPPATETVPIPTTPPVASSTAVPLTSTPLPATATAAPTVAAPTATVAAPATVAPTATAVVQAEGNDGQSGLEKIAILAPGPGSRVTSPLTVSGEADSTFEQSLVVRLVSADGMELALVPTTIQSELGQRGGFKVEIPFAVTGQTQAFIQVFSASPADGAIEHLSSVGVTLAESGPVEIRPAAPTEERIRLTQPASGATITGGVVRVEGIALASFEQTLVIDLLDFDGNTLARVPVTVQAPDLGQPGPFSATISYNVSASMPARISVRDPSPAFNGTLHLSSTIVTLAP